MTQVKTSDEAASISLYTDALKKGMNPFVCKQQSRVGSLALVKKTLKKKENSEIKPGILCLKSDLVSHPTHGGGVG